MRYLVLIYILGLVSCSKEVKKTPEELYLSWKGVYTKCEYSKDKIYSARATFIIDSVQPVFINSDKNEYLGKITSIEEKEIHLSFLVEGKEQTHKIIKKDSLFSPEGPLMTKDSLEIEQNDWLKKEKFSIIKLSKDELPRIFNTEYNRNLVQVTSKNGLVLRTKPTIQSEKITTIPYQYEVVLMARTDVYHKINLSKENEVVGNWLHVYFKDEKGTFNVGYVFDYFVNLDYDIYNLPIDRSSEDPDRRYVDVYTAKQFFDNLGDMVTLNIKAKQLDLLSYLKQRESLEYDRDYFDFSIDYLDNKSRYGYFEDGDGGLQMFLQGYYDMEITTDNASVIKLPTLELLGCFGVLFNKVRLKSIKESSRSAIIFGYRTENIGFSNMTFYNQSFFMTERLHMAIRFETCNFLNYRNTILQSNTDAPPTEYFQVYIDNSKFWNNNINELFNLKGENVSLTNSFVGFNKYQKLYREYNTAKFEVENTVIRDNKK